MSGKPNNPKSDRLESMQHASTVQEEMFEVQTINGIIFQRETKPAKNLDIVRSVTFFPTEIETINTESGQKMAYLNSLRCLSMYSVYKLDMMTMKLFLHSRHKVITMKLLPFESLKMAGKIYQSNRMPFCSSLSLTYSSKFLNLNWYISAKGFSSLSSMTLKAHIGRPIFSVGFQILDQISFPYQYSFLINHVWGENAILWALIHDTTNIQYAMKMKKKLTDNWTAGVSFQTDKNLISSMTVSWKTSINNSVIHSAFNTNGLVKTKFSHRLNPYFRFGLTASISHPEKRYRFGVLMLWDTPDKDE